ncbi:unnamed protein product [Mycena citricolor]|uniref:Uncharacterized protein n=1 Tax=Mycena citricolor TaxID=2018698 RepID=A0AAD2H027_9AGAR|nr:unnamed protein product [Mycena citricolor]
MFTTRALICLAVAFSASPTVIAAPVTRFASSANAASTPSSINLPAPASTSHAAHKFSPAFWGRIAEPKVE